MDSKAEKKAIQSFQASCSFASLVRGGSRAHNSVGTGGMGTQMARTRFPDLNILDAIWINAHPRGGPLTTYDEASHTGVIAASIDPAALDYWAAKNILMPAVR